MRIHLLSDLHLETGPYTIPEDLEFDVLVAAGDISDRPEQAIEFLKSVGKPVVYVLGNHDYWSKNGDVDMADRLAELKTLAAGSNVHVLENESLVIDDTRFLGCTLWTGFGAQQTDSRLRKPNIDLQRIAWGVMNDFYSIGNQSWWTQENTERWQAWLAETGHIDHGEYKWFNPVAAYDLHAKSLDWLRDELRRGGDWSQTIVVTHHAPSWQILEAANVLPRPLETLDNPRLWAVSQAKRDTDHYGPQLYRLAGYATPLDSFLLNYQGSIALWCHGHIHEATDVPINGVRVISNPHGYSLDAYRVPWKKIAAEQGIDNVPEGWRDRLDDLNCGDGHHDERLLIDPYDGAWPLVIGKIEAGIKELEALLAEITEIQIYRKQRNRILKTCVTEAFDARMSKFCKVSEELIQLARKNLVSQNATDGPMDPIGFLLNPGRMSRWSNLNGYLHSGSKSTISDAKKALFALKQINTARNHVISARKRVSRRALVNLKEMGIEGEIDFDDCRLLSTSIPIWVTGIDVDLWNRGVEALRKLGQKTGFSLGLRDYNP